MAKIGINIATGSLQQREMIAGIDLGTTNSLVAIIHPESKQPVVLKEYGSGSLVPSIIYFDEAGHITVGEEAKKHEVSFLINADGILNVKAKELRSGIEQSIEVKPQYGLTDEEVEKTLMDSIAHAKDDMNAGALVETLTEAKQLTEATEGFIEKNSSFLTQDEIHKTNMAIKHVKEVLDSGNKDLIHQKIEALNEISRPYAERLMDTAISTAMSGKNI